MLIRLTDLLKTRGITTVLVALTPGDAAAESTSVAISSLVDVWLLLRNLELAGERTRGLYVCKARGLAHSNQIREFMLTDEGVRLVDVMLDGAGGVLTGSARALHLRSLEEDASRRQTEAGRRRDLLADRQRVVESRINAMRVESEHELRSMEADLLASSELADRAGRISKDLAARRLLHGRDGR